MKVFISTIIYCLRSLLFYPLLFLRGIFLNVSKFLIGLTFLAFITTLLFKAPSKMTIIFISISFSLFLLSFFYDLLLIKLNPTKTELTLDR